MSDCVDLVKALACGPCSCYHVNGSCSVSAVHGELHSITSYDPGTLVRCLRCRARQALENDGVQFEHGDSYVVTVH